MRNDHVDILGQRFGLLIAKEYLGNSKWKCQCDCGNITISSMHYLIHGKRISCGCSSRERNSIAHTTHKQSKTRLYRIWRSMKQRCRNPKASNYDRYGNKGVEVCSEWANSFETFRDWALGHGYSKELTIDRIDSSQGYSPDNCRWATYKEQANNRSSNKLMKYNGEVKTIAEWSELFNVRYSTVLSRLHKGWSFERALTTPVQEHHRREV